MISWKNYSQYDFKLLDKGEVLFKLCITNYYEKFNDAYEVLSANILKQISLKEEYFNEIKNIDVSKSNFLTSMVMNNLFIVHGLYTTSSWCYLTPIFSMKSEALSKFVNIKIDTEDKNMYIPNRPPTPFIFYKLYVPVICLDFFTLKENDYSYIHVIDVDKIVKIYREKFRYEYNTFISFANFKILKNLVDDKLVTYYEKKDINWDETD